MGKTLTGIITLGAAIAINVIPGIGQAISSAIVGIGGGTFAALGVAQAVVGALTLGLTAAGLQAGAGLLGLGPSAPKPETTETAIKTERPQRVAAYGERRLYGYYIIYETASNGTAVDVYAIADGEMSEMVAIYIGDDKVTLSGNTVQPGADGRFGTDKVHAYWTNGTKPGAGIPALTGLLPGIWDSSRRGDGVVLLAITFAPVKSKKFLETYPNSTPSASIAAKWQKCPDLYAADPTNEALWTWTENSIRQTAHYLLKREGADYATKIAPALAYWRAAQDVCDEAIPLKAGGSEARYRSCVAHKLTDPHKTTRSALLATCDGWMAPRADGALIVYAGKYYAPTVTIDDSHIVSYDWDGVGVDDDTAVNEITCTYISKAHDYNAPDTTPWTSEEDIAQRGKVLSDSQNLDVPSHGQARRLAKRKQSRNLAINKGTITTNVAGRIVRGHRYINLRIVEAGRVFFDGVAEVTALTRNLSSGGVTFSWVKAEPNIDAWNPATEEGDPAPVGNRVAQQPIATPTIASATPSLAADGSSAQVSVTVNAPDRDDLTWFGRWKVSTDSVWNESTYSDIDGSPSVVLQIGVVPTNASIDVAVAYQIGDGRTSDWSATSTVSTSTAGLAPGPTTNVSATGGAGQVTVNWRNPGSSNYSYTRNYRTPGNTFTSATALTPDDAAGALAVRSATYSGLGAGSYYIWSRAFSASGVGATPTLAGMVVVT